MKRGARSEVALAHASALPAYGALVLMVVWSAHDGGYDADTWYWGALVTLALLGSVGWAAARRPIGRATAIALGAFALYVVWSYASIAWAASPGDALNGSNRALLYLLVVAAFSLVAWRPPQALGVLTGYAISVGVIGAVLLGRMTAHDSTASLFSEGRLILPTGYFNSNAALFMGAALLAVGLSARREMPVALRGLLAAIACGSIDLALLAQSRGWLFTLPAVLLGSIAVSRDRLRFALAAVLPTLGALAATPALLDAYRASTGAHGSTEGLVSAAGRAGRTSLLLCAVVLAASAVLAALDGRSRRPPLALRWRRAIGATGAVLVLAAGVAGATVATHGQPVRFLKTQWHGFTHPSASTSNSGSHFADIGTGRYDAWRVSIKAVLAHPFGGLGQDNFANYYIRNRRTGLELKWTHSLEMRLLAHTGLVGTILLCVFLAAALTAAITARRRGPAPAAALAGTAVLPLAVWLIHGSVDWFWEVPALSGPALGFLALAGGLAPAASVRTAPRAEPTSVRRWTGIALGTTALLASAVALGFPYLSVREVSMASDLRQGNRAQALSDLSTAAGLNPLAADPGRIGGTIALQAGLYAEAAKRFHQAIDREPGGWYAWLGSGLAASALGERMQAQRDFRAAGAINPVQPAVREALRRVVSSHPLTPAQAFSLLVLVR